MTGQSLTETVVLNQGVVTRDDAYLSHVREAGKQSRNQFTAAIKMFCEYVDPQGDRSSDPKQAYTRLTTKLYAPLGLSSKVIHHLRENEDYKNLRDHMPQRLLFALSVLEDDLSRWIPDAIKRNELRSTIKAHMTDEAKKTAAFCGVAPKEKPVKRRKWK